MQQSGVVWCCDDVVNQMPAKLLCIEPQSGIGSPNHNVVHMTRVFGWFAI